MISTQDQLTQARNAKGFYPTTEQKNTALHEMATALRAQCDAILSANQADLDAAQDALSAAMLERLTLTPTILESMAKGIDEVATLPDPVGVVVSTTTRPNGLRIEKVASPMGVIAIIYESRPNVTSDAAALALKAGSVCILRSGKEAYRSAAAIVSALHKGLVSAGFPKEYITLIEDTTRDSATQLMTANGFVDLLIPRGGEGLITACVQGATVPVLETGRGICHLFIDHSADMNRALAIVENAKTSRPSVCNSAEVCLVHRDIAPTFLPLLAQKLREDRLA
ncbi:MAG: glutamate-5-semialdehyde dehydrogenase, partial [Eubacteriales bacterium]